MSILSGHKRYERYIKTSNGYQLCSMKTFADSVHFSDESTAQNNLGAIKGITDSLTATSSNVALSATAGKNLNDNLSWKKLTSSDRMGNTSVTLPADFRELCIKANIKNMNIIVTLAIPKGFLQSTPQQFRSGYFQNVGLYTEQNGAVANFNCSTTSITLLNAFLNNEDATSTTLWIVYYR